VPELLFELGVCLLLGCLAQAACDDVIVAAVGDFASAGAVAGIDALALGPFLVVK